MWEGKLKRSPVPFQRPPAECWVLIPARIHWHGMCGHVLKITVSGFKPRERTEMGTELEIQIAAPLPPASTRGNQLCVSHPQKTLEGDASGIFREVCVSMFPFCRHKLAPIIPRGQHTSGTGRTALSVQAPRGLGFPKLLCPRSLPQLGLRVAAHLLRSGGEGTAPSQGSCCRCAGRELGTGTSNQTPIPGHHRWLRRALFLPSAVPRLGLLVS